MTTFEEYVNMREDINTTIKKIEDYIDLKNESNTAKKLNGFTHFIIAIYGFNSETNKYYKTFGKLVNYYKFLKSDECYPSNETVINILSTYFDKDNIRKKSKMQKSLFPLNTRKINDVLSKTKKCIDILEESIRQTRTLKNLKKYINLQGYKCIEDTDNNSIVYYKNTRNQSCIIKVIRYQFDANTFNVFYSDEFYNYDDLFVNLTKEDKEVYYIKELRIAYKKLYSYKFI